jgi:hypothetical protein
VAVAGVVHERHERVLGSCSQEPGAVERREGAERVRGPRLDESSGSEGAL